MCNLMVWEITKSKESNLMAQALLSLKYAQTNTSDNGSFFFWGGVLHWCNIGRLLDQYWLGIYKYISNTFPIYMSINHPKLDKSSQWCRTSLISKKNWCRALSCCLKLVMAKCPSTNVCVNFEIVSSCLTKVIRKYLLLAAPHNGTLSAIASMIFIRH